MTFEVCAGMRRALCSISLPLTLYVRDISLERCLSAKEQAYNMLAALFKRLISKFYRLCCSGQSYQLKWSVFYSNYICLLKKQQSIEGWEVRHSKSRARPYFYNSMTSTSVWDKPDGLTDDQIATLPGADLLVAPAESIAPPSDAKVRASHLLVKHAGSRRPSSWKEVPLSYS